MKYRVNGLNNKGVEVWKYCNYLTTAKKIQRRAIAKGIESVIYEKPMGQYIPYKGIELLSEDDTTDERGRNRH